MKTTILASFLSLSLVPIARAQCIGDIAIDARVDGGDLGVLLANWGPVTSTSLSRACDLDGNGLVNGADLGMLLANWGSCPVPAWAMVLEAQPDPYTVSDPGLRAAIQATGLPWRVRDKGTGIEMLLVPPGTFQMGCSVGSDQYGCSSWEQPVHQVTLSNPFYLGRHEVTQAQWTATMGSNPSYFQGRPDSQSRPVERVSWIDVQGFLSATGLRLPTEAEWEFACRAGTQAPFYNGSTDDSTVGELAWFEPNAGGQTHAVGGKLANGFGLYDMLGNVWEWVNDWYDAYPSTAQLNPVGPSGASVRILRGGGWTVQWTIGVRSSCRGTGVPDEQYYFGGFRVARNP
jgi:formylglycine-generating enzyme required for sulfatase activity